LLREGLLPAVPRALLPSLPLRSEVLCGPEVLRGPLRRSVCGPLCSSEVLREGLL
jgi:hypothetical protein